MEGNDAIFKDPKCQSQHAPRNNPFDELWKMPLDTTTSEQVNRRSSIGIRLSEGFFDMGRRSLSFCDFDAGDFGKESMGILPPNFGRDSSCFMNLSCSEFGRESLGILQIDALRDSFSFRRESLGIFNLTDLKRESLDSGRESLGILHLKPADYSIIDEKSTIPDILLTAVEESNDYIGNTFNTALLNPHPRKNSSASSSSSLNHFNSRSLEGPSKIYSLSSMRSFEETTKSDILNKAFCKNFDFSNLTCTNSSIISSIHSPFNKARLFSPSELHISPTRIKSLPATSRESFDDETDVMNVIGRHFWTAAGTLKTKTLEKRGFHGVLDFNEEDTGNDFHDSVFIEGHHIAEKIADGSILNDSTGGEIGILDSTPQPEWPDEISENEDKEKEDPKCNTETVFKNVDKLLPAPILNTDFKIKTSKTDSNSSNENGSDKINISENNELQASEKSVSKPIHNISDIAHEPETLSVSHKSQSKSRDAKEILHNLSEIINCTNRSELQKSEGQNLLNSLADILCENKSKVKNTCLDDSGHSSIIDEQLGSPEKNHECFDAVDLYTKTTSEGICNEHVSDKNSVDLSLKPIKSIADNRLTQSFSSSVPSINTMPLNMMKKRNTSASGLDFNKNRSIASNNSSVNSNNSKTSSNSSRPSITDGVLRRKTFSYSGKKGPMKAVIPIGDMKKKHIGGTPDRAEQKIPSIINRTSTPIKEPNLKPMAASTPTGRPIRDKKITPISLLERPKKENTSITMSKSGVNTSAPLPKSSIRLNSGLVRRNSVSEMKRTSENVGKLTRSYSIEKETGIMSSLAKVRQNIVSSPYYQLKKKNALKESNNICLPNNKEKIGINKSLPEAKSTNLESKLKRVTCLTSNKLTERQSPNKMKSLPTGKEAIESSDIQRGKIHKFQPSNTDLKFVKPILSNDTKKVSDFTSKLKRRNSVGKECGMMSSLPKIRRNILTSPHYRLEKENVSNGGSFSDTPDTRK